jgi:hypothetical protein
VAPPRAEALALLLLAGCGPAEAPRTGALHHELRPDTPDSEEAPPRFDPGDRVERFSDSVVVHFTRAGRHAVPALDDDRDGAPDFVEEVAATYREVRALYHQAWGFRLPPDDARVPRDNGGDARFDVYLLDFARRADGSYRRECLEAGPCTGYTAQENDFAGYGYPSAAVATRIVSSHEYFHAVQAGYQGELGATFSEGTAVWASERFDPSLDDLEHFAPSYLAEPERSLDLESTGPVDSYGYGSALFFECVASSRGPDSVRALFEQLRPGRSWLEALALGLDGGLAAELRRCFDFNLFTGTRTRAGYGHRRAERLGEAPVIEANGALEVKRARLFRVSSRYWKLRGAAADAAIWWSPLEGGEEHVQLRAALDVPGAPAFVELPANRPTPLGPGDWFILASHLREGADTAPIQLCAGPPALVERCTSGSGSLAAEADPETEREPGRAGCDSTGGAPLLGLLLALHRWKTRT